ncbi:small GTP-binding protein, putative [Trichomonas vaginalis G3]|uniref:Small GTP-binding protein, putative n=1 Tax=Trichomonas vaginalis (strain ATCC PRA-98 / G3) TaxID=412133 RepID=A2E9S2_TRIV3|nr:GTPase protein [Trichomonas vaginalis G3]EAY10607.1 small GTP-binding protein, putative [Trichomonas vaginalis G3]KAI5540859.1 GTPase protein [Trichomonas vaginalis G3]|eukprot:XP_001322830.1 small GTP-binding protein [Trichomonas vaginalis G3]
MGPALEFKIVIIGSVAVGKTAITNRLQYQQFEEDYQPTIGAGYIPYRTSCDGKDVELQIWDTAGMERYKSLGPIYYRDAVAAIIVYDQTDQESADVIKKWLDAFRGTVKTHAFIAIAANKDDLPNKVVNNNEVKQWAEENDFSFFITSAKSGVGVNEMFQTLVREVMKTYQTTTKAPSTVPTPDLTTPQQDKKGCC